MNGIIGKGKKIFREKLRSFKEVLETAKELSKEESREMIALVLHETLRFLKTCRVLFCNRRSLYYGAGFRRSGTILSACAG